MCVNNFGSSRRFLGVFVEFSKIKSSPITGVSQITKYLNINPILTSYYYIQKIIASMTCFCKTFISSLTSQQRCTKNLLCKWRHYPTVTTLPDLTVPRYQCFGSVFIFSWSGSRVWGWRPLRIRIQSGSRALMTKNWKKITAEKKFTFFFDQKLQFTFP